MDLRGFRNRSHGNGNAPPQVERDRQRIACIGGDDGRPDEDIETDGRRPTGKLPARKQ